MGRRLLIILSCYLFMECILVRIRSAHVAYKHRLERIAHQRSFNKIT